MRGQGQRQDGTRPGPMALDGVRILDFTRLGFGSQATLICGRLGAEVIRVESTVHPTRCGSSRSSTQSWGVL